MLVLITGGTGFIGSAIAESLIAHGHRVIITGTTTEKRLPLGLTKFLNLHLTGIDWSYLKDVDVVFHQSAINDTQNLDRGEMMRANVDAPKQLFEKALLGGCKKFIYASSTAIYGNRPAPYLEDMVPQPLTPYAESKLVFDDFAMEFAERHGVSVTGLRYSNVYGPGEDHKGKRASMIWQMIKDVRNNRRPKLFEDGEQKRDWIYIEDVVTANLLAMNGNATGIFNCATGEATSFNTIMVQIANILGVGVFPEYIPNPISQTFQAFTCCNINKINATFGFKPAYSIERGLVDYVDKTK